MTTPEDASRIFQAHMSRVLAGGDDRLGFLTGHTRNLMNPNFGRRGMPRLFTREEVGLREEHLLSVATGVINGFIEFPTGIYTELDEMSPVIKDFATDYPDENPRIHKGAYIVGMLLAHRIIREAGMLPDITKQDIEQAVYLPENIGEIGRKMVNSLIKISDDGHQELGDKIRRVSMKVPVDQKQSLDLALRHLSSIVSRHELVSPELTPF